MSQREDVNRNRAQELDRLGIAHTPCATCGYPTPMLGTKRCDGCWEVESRIDTYLRLGGHAAKKFLMNALERHIDG